MEKIVPNAYLLTICKTMFVFKIAKLENTKLLIQNQEFFTVKIVKFLTVMIAQIKLFVKFAMRQLI